MEKTMLAKVPVTAVPLKQKTFYVIERFDTIHFVLDDDGNVKTFESFEEAAAEADECQDGYVLCF